MRYLVTFYFTSGEKMNVSYSKEKLGDLCSALKQAWSSCHTTGEDWGINFMQVTHYEVKAVDGEEK